MGIKINEGVTEAQATAVFFLENSKFNTAQVAAVVDIGGGTTDISFWSNRKVQWEDSVKFAGSNAVAALTDLWNYILSKVGAKTYEEAMRKWPYVASGWDDSMEAYFNGENNNAKRTKQTLALFYAGICYYVGMHLKANDIKTPLSQIAFAGNGIRFLEIITLGNELSENESTLKVWINFLREMISAGQGAEQKAATSFLFSKSPKLEVAKGLVSKVLANYVSNESVTKKMLGLNVRMNGTLIEYNSWSAYNATDFLESSNTEIDFSMFNEFVKHFKEKGEKHFKEWNLKEIPDELTVTQIRHFYNTIEQRGSQELANSLFLEALNAYM